MAKKKQINEGLFDAADKFVHAFFKGLERNTANQVIKKQKMLNYPLKQSI